MNALTNIIGTVEQDAGNLVQAVFSGVGATVDAGTATANINTMGLQLQALAQQYSSSQPMQQALGGSVASLVSAWQAQAQAALASIQSNPSTATAQYQAVMNAANALKQKVNAAWAQVSATPGAGAYAGAAVSSISDFGNGIIASIEAIPNTTKFIAIAAAAAAYIYYEQGKRR